MKRHSDCETATSLLKPHKNSTVRFQILHRIICVTPIAKQAWKEKSIDIYINATIQTITTSNWFIRYEFLSPKKQFMTTAKLKECFDIIMLQKAKHLKKQEVQSILIILLFCFLCHPRRIHKLTNSFQFLKWLTGKKLSNRITKNLFKVLFNIQSLFLQIFAFGFLMI